MPKTRFSSIDIRTTVHNLQRTVIGLRLANVYDLSPRVFLFKLSKPELKKQLIIESGIRIHSTNFTRDKGDHTPAPFSITLRKYLKTKRLESVKQLGVDRIVDFTFGSGIATQHLIIELFSIGNIILTDGDYKVIAILRTHQYTENENIAVGDVYPVEKAKKPTNFTPELINELLEKGEKKDNLKQLFNRSLDFGPELIEHCLLEAGLSPNQKLESYDRANNAKLIQSFVDAQKIYNVSTQSKGYIVLRPPKTPEDTTVIYEEFVPYLYKQYQSKPNQEYDTFDHAVDQFFSEIEAQRVEQQRIAQEQTVLKKLDKVREDQQRRIDSLFASEADNVRKAQLIEANLQEVDQCITIIRSGVKASMDWTALSQLLKEEKKKNPYSVANLIHKLKLDSNQITLALNDNYDDDYDEDEDDDDDEKKNQKKEKKKPTLIDVDISLTAFANAREFYDSKKHANEKAHKTIQQAEFALKAAEKKTRQQLSEVKAKSAMIQMRKVFWFEKFHWFLSSDNYIVISGKDAQQNEILFKKYLEKDDIYVHADIFGSTSCVIKNPNGGPVPPNTLIQAGTMTMCYSNAWSAKVVTSAYWVYANQVSKTAPSGEYLTTGSFMIRGKKNYLPHSQLVMGFGFMFKVDESCIANHLGERAPSNASYDQEEEPVPGDDDVPAEKKLRKFERAKLKKEQEDQAFMEMDGMDVSEQITNTTTSSVATGNVLGESTESTASSKYRIKLVSSFHEPEDEVEEKQENDQEDQDDDAQDSDDGEKSSKQRLSAHQRKLLKKEKERVEKGITEEPKPTEPKQAEPKPKEKKPKGEPTKHLTLGQKNKLKKIKEKYGDQDEDERKERLELLGSAGNKKDKKKDKKEKDGKGKNNNNKGGKGGKNDNNNNNKSKTSQEKSTTTTTSSTTTTTTTEKKKEETSVEEIKEKVEEMKVEETFEQEGLSSESEEEGEEVSEEVKKERLKRKEKREQKLKEQEEIKQLLEEENMAPALESDNISNIDTLTGQPLDNDILHFAIPVVGPYSIFTNFKYKVKLTPGHQKRGKAAKQAVQVLLQNPSISAREKELIKNIKDEELSANMLADVRLHAPNLLATKKKEKQMKKEAAKERANEEAQTKEEKKESGAAVATPKDKPQQAKKEQANKEKK